MNLEKFYATDECLDKDRLFEKINKLKKLGRISYKENDRGLIEINDLELTEKEEKDLILFFEELDVYPVEEEDYKNNYYLDEFDDFEDYRDRDSGNDYNDYEEF
jgi:hypothetical protein